MVNSLSFTRLYDKLDIIIKVIGGLTDMKELGERYSEQNRIDVPYLDIILWKRSIYQ